MATPRRQCVGCGRRRTLDRFKRGGNKCKHCENQERNEREAHLAAIVAPPPPPPPPDELNLLLRDWMRSDRFTQRPGGHAP